MSRVGVRTAARALAWAYVLVLAGCEDAKVESIVETQVNFEAKDVEAEAIPQRQPPSPYMQAVAGHSASFYTPTKKGSQPAASPTRVPVAAPRPVPAARPGPVRAPPPSYAFHGYPMLPMSPTKPFDPSDVPLAGGLVGHTLDTIPSGNAQPAQPVPADTSGLVQNTVDNNNDPSKIPYTTDDGTGVDFGFTDHYVDNPAHPATLNDDESGHLNNLLEPKAAPATAPAGVNGIPFMDDLGNVKFKEVGQELHVDKVQDIPGMQPLADAAVAMHPVDSNMDADSNMTLLDQDMEDLKSNASLANEEDTAQDAPYPKPSDWDGKRGPQGDVPEFDKSKVPITGDLVGGIMDGGSGGDDSPGVVPFMNEDDTETAFKFTKAFIDDPFRPVPKDAKSSVSQTSSDRQSIITAALVVAALGVLLTVGTIIQRRTAMLPFESNANAERTKMLPADKNSKPTAYGATAALPVAVFVACSTVTCQVLDFTVDRELQDFSESSGAMAHQAITVDEDEELDIRDRCGHIKDDYTTLL